MRTSLKATLVAVVGGLVALACEEKENFSFKPLAVEKACELEKRGSRLSEEECEKLCADDSVDECSLVVAASNTGLCAPDASADAGAVFRDALICTEKYLEPANPFASKTVEGRRPEGFESTANAVVDLGSYFAACSELEAASVDAFERLGRELEAFGAPSSLVARSRRARRDEIRHARWTAALARKHGRSPPAPAPAPLTVRTLFEMALENAIEGVVRETFGAARALFRAQMIQDARAARVMRRIADDELAHAELSWDVAAFAWSRLDVEERAPISLAMRQELDRLGRADDAAPDDPLRQAAGLPDRRTETHLVETIARLVEEAGFLAAA